MANMVKDLLKEQDKNIDFNEIRIQNDRVISNFTLKLTFKKLSIVKF